MRIFKCLGNSKVYHFGSVTITKKKDVNFRKNQGSIANKIFILKWGFSIKFFKKHFLKSTHFHNEILNNPKKIINFFLDLFKDKILFYYYKLFSSIKTK